MGSVAALATVLALQWSEWRLRLASDEALAGWAEARPADGRVQRALGERLRRRGEAEAAVIALERAAALRPGDLATRRELARTLIALHRADAALPHLREVVRLEPGDAFAQEHLGDFYLAQGATSWAADAFERVVAARPRDGQAWAHLGSCYLELHQGDRALRAFRRACELEPDRSEYQVGLGRAHLETGHRDRAEVAFRRGLDGPAGAQAAYWLGVACATPAPGREEEAIRWLQEAARRAPQDPGPWLALGKLMLRRHQPDQAVPALKRAVTLAPHQPEPLYHLARAYQALGRSGDARTLLRHFDSLTALEQQRRHLELRLTQSPRDPELRRRLAALSARREEVVPAAAPARQAPEARGRAGVDVAP